MKKILIITGTILLSCYSAVAQTDKEKARKFLQEAVKIMDNGQIDESILLLDSARMFDPDNYVYDYETGFAYQMKKDYKKAIKYFEATTKNKNTTDQCYQMLGNNYDHDGNSKKAIETYNEGLKKFPNSGKLYVELGVMALIAEDYNKAVESWEKGISVNPEYASNYYRLAKLYAASKDRIWALFYGEMFMNMEVNSGRTKEISKMLFKAYKESIDITSDTSSKVDFARPMVITSYDPSKKFKFPFDQVFGMDFLIGMTPSVIAKKKEVDIAYLNVARTGFLDWWYKQKRDKEYNNIIIDFQKTIKDNGHFEAYNYWLLMSGDEKEFAEWYATNEEKFKAFANWFNKNPLEVNSKHYFLRTTVDQ
jgi:tetratricopeptide (TPR) repeat protein